MVNLPFTCKGCPNRYPGCSGKCEKYKAERAEYERLKNLAEPNKDVRNYVRTKKSQVSSSFVKRRKKGFSWGTGRRGW